LPNSDQLQRDCRTALRPVVPNFKTLKPASSRASGAAKASSKKRNTKPELILRHALWRMGCRYRTNISRLLGRPDIVFIGERLAVFCDGDFWHGKNWTERRRRLLSGHNSKYWIAKINSNIRRDRLVQRELEALGWRVLRCWESDIAKNAAKVAQRVVKVLGEESRRARSSS
jgi:DNA mismatch endonuclease, patch repair protein